MKRLNLFTCFIIAGCISANLLAQSLSVEMKNGSTTVTDLSTLESIVYKRNNLQFQQTDGTTNYYSLPNLQKMYFGVNTATETISEVNGLTLYPNPTRSTLNIGALQNSAKATVYNIQGKAIKSMVLDNQNNAIDVSDLTSGVYILSINNQSYTFVKQ